MGNSYSRLLLEPPAAAHEATRGQARRRAPRSKALERWRRDFEARIAKAMGGAVYSVAWSFRGAMLAVGDDARQVTALDAAAMGEQVLWRCEMGGAVFSVAWSSDDAMLAVGDDANQATVLDAAAKGEQRRIERVRPLLRQPPQPEAETEPLHAQRLALFALL